jgi:hypothetical protein
MIHIVHSFSDHPLLGLVFANHLYERVDNFYPKQFFFQEFKYTVFLIHPAQ